MYKKKGTVLSRENKYQCSAPTSAIYTKITLYDKNARNDLPAKLFHASSLLCGASAKGVTPVYVASVTSAPHIIGW
jgi:hypothetical protein